MKSLSAKQVTTLFAVSALMATSAVTWAEHLSIEQIFSKRDLNGTSLSELEFSADGTRLTFLRGKAEDADTLDLWEYSIAEKQSRLLVDSRSVPFQDRPRDEVEDARRERLRITATGVVKYAASPDGRRVAFPLGGDLYLHNLRKQASNEIRQLTSTVATETDAKFSPTGRYVSFIRDQDLFIIDIETGAERQLTFDGDGLIKNGMPEFVALEEMERTTGYWWSPSETHLAFARVDETPVEPTPRFQVDSNGVRIIRERYPRAGTPNVSIQLNLLRLADGEVVPVDLGRESDIYLTRVGWLPDGSALSFQTQSRDQKVLELRIADLTTGASRRSLRESSRTWINLHKDLHFLDDSPQFVSRLSP